MDSLNDCRETEQKVLDPIRAATAPVTLRQLIEALNDTLGTWPQAAAQDLAYALNGHLQRLAGRGQIAAMTADSGRVGYQSV